MIITNHHSSCKVVNITYQTPEETLLGSPETLPTSEPGTPQVAYTVTTGHLPTFSIEPYSKQWCTMIFGAGKFVTAGTLSHRLKKNGASVSTGSGAVAANTYFTIQGHCKDIVVDDVYEIALWSNQTDSIYEYKAFQAQVTRYKPKQKNQLYQPFGITATGHPVLTLGVPSASTTHALRVIVGDSSSNLSISTSFAADALASSQTYGRFRLEMGDINSTLTNRQTHATYRPYFWRNYCPTQMIYRMLNF